jgi:hypothetical protein
MAFEAIVVAVQALFQVGLLGHGEDDDIAFALQLLDDQLRAHHAGFVIVGSDEGEPFAGGGVGIDGHDGDALADSGIDIGLHDGGIRDGNHDAGGFNLLGENVLEEFVLRFGVEIIGSHHFGLYAQLLGGVHQAGTGALPVGDLDVGRHQPVLFGRGVRGTAAPSEPRQRAAAKPDQDPFPRSHVRPPHTTVYFTARVPGSTGCYRNRR